MANYKNIEYYTGKNFEIINRLYTDSEIQRELIYEPDEIMEDEFSTFGDYKGIMETETIFEVLNIKFRNNRYATVKRYLRAVQRFLNKD